MKPDKPIVPNKPPAPDQLLVPNKPLVPDRLLVIGGSAGSLQIILSALSAIGDDFPMPVLVVIHRNGIFESNLEELFYSRTAMVTKEVEEKDQPMAGTVYLCPADYHVLFEKDHSFSLDYSERVHFSRPSIDVTFRSAADVYGPGVIGLLLSGGNADGAEGLAYMQERGGRTIVQDPLTADVPYMPQQAISRMKPNFIVPSEEIPAFIRQLGYR
jgi:two-component system chemotaxis response regulator CheB